MNSKIGYWCSVPVSAFGRAYLQEQWGLPSDKVTVNASRKSMKRPSIVDTSTERMVNDHWSLAQPPRRGIREDPGRVQLYSFCILTLEISGTVCVRGRLPPTFHFFTRVLDFHLE